MKQLIKRISLVMLILGPLSVCGLILFFRQSEIAIIVAIAYLAIMAAIICISVVTNYKSILLKLGYYPIYQPITPPKSDKHCMSNHFQDKIIAFVGDSVTFGCDDDKEGSQLKQPWPKEIASLLGCSVINYGVPSASVLDIDSWTPIAWGKAYTQISEKADIIGIMIGINDCFRDYPIGLPGDSDNSTFYGGLDSLIKGLTAKFRPNDGKKIFLLIYPHYDADSKFKQYVKAMYDVAEKYSLSVCDLSLTLGVSPYNDPDYFFWRKYKDNIYHSPHTTQVTAHLIAETVSNFILSHYYITSKAWEENLK